MFVSFTILLLFQIAVCNSRIVWLATLFSLVVVTLNNKVSLKKITLLFCSLVIIAIPLLYYKINSTFGRLFIYKINFQIIKENFWWGINKPYNVIFNHTQANHFNINSLNTSNALLASNGYFTFNEWLGVFINYGIIGFILFTAFTVYLVYECFQQLQKHKSNKTAIAIILFLLVVEMVSYPFSFGIYTSIFLCCTVILLQHSIWFNLNKYSKPTLWVAGFGLCIFFLYKDVNSYFKNQKIEFAKESFKIGYFNQSLETALTEIKEQPNNGELAYFISKIYFQVNKIYSSLFYIQLAHQNLCTDELHFHWGNYYTAKKDFENAKQQYLQATYIMPSRFKNRLALIDSYLKLNKRDSAFVYSSLTANLTEKIPSTLSNFYKQKAINLRDSLLNLKGNN